MFLGNVSRAMRATSCERLTGFDRAARALVAAGEGEHLPHHVGAARGALVDHRDRGDRLRIARLRPQQIGAHQDRREHVVEIVGDAAGERADALHALGAQEVRLELLALADVERVPSVRVGAPEASRSTMRPRICTQRHSPCFVRTRYSEIERRGRAAECFAQSSPTGPWSSGWMRVPQSAAGERRHLVEGIAQNRRERAAQDDTVRRGGPSPRIPGRRPRGRAPAAPGSRAGCARPCSRSVMSVARVEPRAVTLPGNRVRGHLDVDRACRPCAGDATDRRASRASGRSRRYASIRAMSSGGRMSRSVSARNSVARVAVLLQRGVVHREKAPGCHRRTPTSAAGCPRRAGDSAARSRASASAASRCGVTSSVAPQMRAGSPVRARVISARVCT